MPKSKLRLAAIGEAVWDCYPHHRTAGGSAVNYAFHARRIGHEGILLSRIGRDTNGRSLHKALTRFGIDISGVQFDENRSTGTVEITTGADGEPRFYCSPDCAFDYFEDFSPWLSQQPEFDALIFTARSQRGNESRNQVRKAINVSSKNLLVFDLNLSGKQPDFQSIVIQSLKSCDLVKLNEAELNVLREILNLKQRSTIACLEHILEEFQIDLVCLTLGSHGAIALTGEDAVYCPGLEIQVSDTVGAGDSFTVGLTAGLLTGLPLRDALTFANALAAFVTTRFGATPVYSYSEFENFRKGKHRHAYSLEFKHL